MERTSTNSSTARSIPEGPEASRLTRRSVLVAGGATAGVLLIPTASRASAGTTISVAAGQTYVVSATTKASVVTIASGGVLAAPSGYSLSMTVNGVETGGTLTATGAAATQIAAGTYRGDIVLTVAAANDIAFGGLTFPFRQALYVNGSGVATAGSVLAAVIGGKLTDTYADRISVTSTGEAFDGLYLSDGSYTLTDPKISLTGNGRCDFVGYGAALVADGASARLVVDGASIHNHGAVRTGVIVNDGATAVIKNSVIQTKNGVLPDDYQPTVNTTYMESAPWMLSISGNVRATNLLGNSSIAAYVNSTVMSEGWGILSTDSGQNCTLVSIDNKLVITGKDGYGSYAIGNATEHFLGTQFDVGTYATINRGGAVYYTDATHTAITTLNTSLNLGLTAQEIASLPERPTVINSRRFGMMWHGAGTVDVSGGTVINTQESTFLDKGQQVGITVDGSRGAELNPKNGIILQVMENDDPGPVFVDGNLVNAGVYTEPTGDPAKYAAFDITAAHATDAVATFTAIALKGNFYNGMRGGSAMDPGLNLVLTLEQSSVEGVISATKTAHHVSTIDATRYEQLGEITNTVQPVVNNGVLVTLGSGSSWTVTGTSYLSRLTLAADATVTGPHKHSAVSMTVDGTATTITPGNTYTGAITITITVS